jgi:hypothetical protein
MEAVATLTGSVICDMTCKMGYYAQLNLKISPIQKRIVWERLANILLQKVNPHDFLPFFCFPKITGINNCLED